MNSASSSKPALVGLILAVSMTTIDQTIVALSAPTIQQNLGLSHDGMQWAVNVYLLTTAAFFLLGGRVADVVGHKRMALVGIAGFGITSLLCGLTPSGDLAEAWLVGARALQGVSGAIMFPAAIGIVVEGFARERRGRAMAIFFTITGAMTAVGPIAGGYLTQWTWRSIFWVNVPIAVVSFVIAALTARPSTRRRERIDWLGAAVVAAGMAALVFGLQQASPWGWGNAAVLASLIGGAVLLVLFGRLQLRTAQPLVQLRAFRDRGVLFSRLATLFASIAFMSAFFFLSVWGQVSLQLTAMETGILFLKFFIGFVIGSRIGSVRFDRQGAKAMVLLGGVVGAAGFVWLALGATDLGVDGSIFFNAQTAPLVLAGAGIGLMFTPVSTDAVNRAAGATYGEASALTQTMKNFGGALGIAVFSTIVTSRLTDLLTASFAKFGGSAANAQDAVNQISGASDRSSALSTLPHVVQEQILHAVRSDYASAVQWAFWGMAAAMAVVAVIGLLYPAGRTSLPEGDERVQAGASTETAATDASGAENATV